MTNAATDKQFVREAIPKVRLVWRKFDPIGVFSDVYEDWPDDEYDSYLGKTLELTLKGEEDKLRAYIKHVVCDRIGLSLDTDAMERMLTDLWTLKSSWENDNE